MKNFLKVIFRMLKDIKANVEIAFYKLKPKSSMKILKGYNKKIFYLMLPTYGNLGDQAIALATQKMLKDQFADYEVVTFNDEDTYKAIGLMRKYIKNEDIIFLQGGGNMGDIYPDAERERYSIIKNFKNNKIVIMTQTSTFTYTLPGHWQLRKAKKIYNSHKDLTMLAREDRSYKFMKKNFSNAKIELVPDIVFYLYKKTNIDNKLERGNFITTCIRNDQESVQKDHARILNDVKDLDRHMFIYDTCVARRVDEKNRQLEVESLMNQFRRSRLVVTDRMHGMVIAAITGTPCIVTKSLDYKITGTYKWIKDLNYIFLVKDLSTETLRDNVEKITHLEKKDDLSLKEKYFLNFREKIGIENE